ncbi:MAG: heteromeric transposase endonuclease subunit TnsA [Acidovorax sp.]
MKNQRVRRAFMKIYETNFLKIAETTPENLQNRRDKSKLVRSVRKIPTNRRSVTGFVSWRGQESVSFESTLERDFVLRQEFSLAVSSVVSQPCEVPFVTRSGVKAIATPDYLVYYKVLDDAIGMEFKPMLVEVKYRDDWKLNWREWLPKWVAIRRYAREQGWIFHVMDENRIRTRALENIMFLRRYDDLDVCPHQSAAIIEDLSELGSSSIDYMLAKHFAGSFRAQGIAHLWHLLATRQLECDICDPLNDDTEIWVAHG